MEDTIQKIPKWYKYLCRDGVWRLCNYYAIEHMKGFQNFELKYKPI